MQFDDKEVLIIASKNEIISIIIEKIHNNLQKLGEKMSYSLIAKILLIPFLGTSLGSACVLFMKNRMSDRIQKILTGFASGVMVAAAIWSLIIPAIEQSEHMGSLAAVPAVVGFCLGMLFLLLLDTITPHMHLNNTSEGPKSSLQKTTMMVLAVVLHNIPEGMAVGVICAGWLSQSANISQAAALTLAIGIAIQNFPEGAIISLPLRSNGVSKGKALLYGLGSGIVEPIAGLITILLSSLVIPILPYLLSFAAGAMIYVVVEELIPEMSQGNHSNAATIFFMLGFSLMLFLDVTLG